MKFRTVLFFLFGVSPASAAIVHSGLRNIPIPTGHDGIYLDIDDGTTATEPFNGWDVTGFFAGVAIGGSASFQPARSGTGNQDPLTRFDAEALIVATLSYSSGETGSSTHLGAPGNFQDGVSGYLGFRYSPNDDSGSFYGWMRLTLTANTPGAVIHEWAWENSGDGIAVGRIPEPASGMYLCAAALILLPRRRKYPLADKIAL